MELVGQANAIFSQGTELMKNPAISGAVAGMYSWMKGVFKNNKRAQERLEQIEKSDANEDAIKGLTSSLDDVLYGNEELQKQLAEKLKEIETIMQRENINNSVTTTTTNINTTGDGNKVVSGVNVKGGDFIIN